ncbi:MAG: histidine phosphatase family protein [Bacteroidota bacterium]|nr:histidine phosphatase family protein [Bacteroidota bacterium]
MKSLIFLRHAKTEHLYDAPNDFGRNLTENGRRTAQKVSEIFSENKIQPDVILCSTANRTRQTLDIFLQNNDCKPDILMLENLYLASASDIYSIIQSYKKYNAIMVIGHNDGLSLLASMLSAKDCPTLSTSALIVFNFKKEIELEKGNIELFINPKAL